MFPVIASSAVFVVKIGQILEFSTFFEYQIFWTASSFEIPNYDGGDIICMRNGKSYSRKFSPKSYVDKNDIPIQKCIGAQTQTSEAGQISGQLHCYV